MKLYVSQSHMVFLSIVHMLPLLPKWIVHTYTHTLSLCLFVPLKWWNCKHSFLLWKCFFYSTQNFVRFSFDYFCSFVRSTHRFSKILFQFPRCAYIAGVLRKQDQRKKYTMICEAYALCTVERNKQQQKKIIENVQIKIWFVRNKENMF